VGFEDNETAGLREYINVSPKIGLVVSSRLATLIELGTVYGTEDLEDFIEIILTDSYNRRQVAKKQNGDD
jgi:hypothetical protein